MSLIKQLPGLTCASNRVSWKRAVLSQSLFRTRSFPTTAIVTRMRLRQTHFPIATSTSGQPREAVLGQCCHSYRVPKPMATPKHETQWSVWLIRFRLVRTKGTSGMYSNSNSNIRPGQPLSHHPINETRRTLHASEVTFSGCCCLATSRVALPAAASEVLI